MGSLLPFQPLGRLYNWVTGSISSRYGNFHGNKNNAECYATQLISGDGAFDGAGLDNFVNVVKLAECGRSYAVVSIMGPQSSGKSTLLNHLFGTSFVEMKAEEGRTQTTTGVWLAKAIDTKPSVLVMDLEGNDGSERGQDASFEKKIALFALAVSDILLINMWCTDLGRENAANKPLLRTIFQAMLRLFGSRKTTLMIVIRDKSKTPLDKLENKLRADIEEIWYSIHRNDQGGITPLSKFFNVEVIALSSYEDKEKMFKDEVANLKRRLLHSINKGHEENRKGVIPASGFSISCQKIWEEIEKDKDLDLPKHQEMMANLRCDQIASEVFSSFESDKIWCEMKETAKSAAVPGFGLRLYKMNEASVKRYDNETQHYDEIIRSSKKVELLRKLTLLYEPTIVKISVSIRRRAFKKFKEELNNALSLRENLDSAAQRCIQLAETRFNSEFTNSYLGLDEEDISPERKELRRDMEDHIAAAHHRVKAEFVADGLYQEDDDDVSQEWEDPEDNTIPARQNAWKSKIALKVCSMLLWPFMGGLDLGSITERIIEWFSN